MQDESQACTWLEQAFREDSENITLAQTDSDFEFPPQRWPFPGIS